VGLKHNSFGLAAQVGADIPLGGGWLLNVDAKKVQIGTTVYLAGADKGKFKVDPLLLAVGPGRCQCRPSSVSIASSGTSWASASSQGRKPWA
jgi:hypothetical protein